MGKSKVFQKNNCKLFNTFYMSLTILLVGKNEVYDFLILHYTYWYEKIGLYKKLFSFIKQLQKIGFARNLFIPHYPIAQKKGK
jgi:hypothetical protein